MPVNENEKTGIMRDEDKTKEQLIEELKWYRENNQYLVRELARVENDNRRLEEEVSNLKGALVANCDALSINCEALKGAFGWQRMPIK